MTSDPLSRLRDGLARDAKIVRAAIDPDMPGTHWQWVTDETDTPVKPGDEQEALEYQRISLRTVEQYPTSAGDLPAFVIHTVEEGIPGALRYIAEFDPARVLRLVDKLREALEWRDETAKSLKGPAYAGKARDDAYREAYVDGCDAILNFLADIYTDDDVR